MITSKSVTKALFYLLAEALFELNGDPKPNQSAISLEEHGDDLVVTLKTGEKVVYSAKVLSAPLPR